MVLQAEKNYSTTEECLAEVWDVQTLRPYQQGGHFIVHSDYASLQWSPNPPAA